MAKDERWEPTDAWSSDDANFAAETTADQARAHYEPIVAELENSAGSPLDDDFPDHVTHFTWIQVPEAPSHD